MTKEPNADLIGYAWTNGSSTWTVTGTFEAVPTYVRVQITHSNGKPGISTVHATALVRQHQLAHAQ